jgi:hypothetical protein
MLAGPLRGFFVSLLAAAALAVAPVQAASVIAPVNLRAADLPRGSSLYSSRVLTGAEVVNNGGAHAFRMRLRGLELAQFDVFGNSTSSSFIAVESDILVYTSAAAAHADYGLAESEPVKDRADIISMPRVGAEYFARSYTQTQGKLLTRVTDIVFRRGAVLCLMRFAAIDGKYSTTQEAASAALIDTRLRQHAASFPPD